MVPSFPIETVVNNQELYAEFKCGISGGMRKSTKTKTLVLILDHTKNLYKDRWENDILYYTGMGKKGDQELKAGNKALVEAKKLGYTVHLFEVSSPKEYLYRGQVELAGDYQFEDQPDEDGNIRKVIVFPLRLKSLNEEDIRLIEETQTKKMKTIRELPLKELKKKISKKRQKDSRFSGAYYVTRKVYPQDEYVKEYVRRRANGKCELCGKTAPFLDPSGTPFLEWHHIVWRSRKGENSIENTVMLCPNCHRKMHILDRDEDREKLQTLKKDIEES